MATNEDNFLARLKKKLLWKCVLRPNIYPIRFYGDPSENISKHVPLAQVGVHGGLAHVDVRVPLVQAGGTGWTYSR